MKGNKLKKTTEKALIFFSLFLLINIGQAFSQESNSSSEPEADFSSSQTVSNDNVQQNENSSTTITAEAPSLYNAHHTDSFERTPRDLPSTGGTKRPIPRDNHDWEKVPPDSSSTLLRVRANVTGASVYVDGSYKGTTPLSVKDISEGRHKVTVKKTHYQSESFYVTLRNGKTEYISCNLYQISGYLNVDAPLNGAEIYVDNVRTSNSRIELDEGYHIVKAKKFGYKTYETSVYIYRLSTKTISFSMELAPFELTNISSTKRSFNPKGRGSIKDISFSISATGPDSAKVRIEDSEGNSIRTANIYFSTWTLNWTWNGFDDAGRIAPEGSYKIIVESSANTLVEFFRIDSSLDFRLFSVSADGLGIGNIPVAISHPENTCYVGTTAQFTINQDHNFTHIPLDFSCTISTKNLEFGGQMCFSFTNYFFEKINTNAKTFCDLDITDQFSIQLGLSGRFSYTSVKYNKKNFYDRGHGFAVGALAGFTAGPILVNYAGQFVGNPFSGMTVLESASGVTASDDCMFKNSLLIQGTFGQVGISAYAAYGILFGNFLNDGVKEDLKGRTVQDAGFELSFFPGESGAIITLRGGSYFTDLNPYSYLPYASLSLGYIF